MSKLFVFLGPTGSGKTTQASKIAEYFDLEKITTGDIVRGRIEKGEMSQEDIQNFTNGFLVYSDAMSDLVHNEIKSRIEQGLVLDGYPRTKSQSSNLNLFLRKADRKVTAIVYITVPKSVAKKRVLGRSRTDDSEESFENRVEQFNIHTKPMLDDLIKQGKVIEVDGSKKSTEVTDEIINDLAPLQ